ncbi:MAG: type I DNA topoisomerase [Phycisphaerae bacterium]|nr:type I DNA topoisomerase [Phycisphaerae bacterium]
MAKGATKSKRSAAPRSKGAAAVESPRQGEQMDERAEEGSGGASGKDLVIVESPAKAKTINKYLGSGYKVMASVGHIRDLPSKNPKGVKSPVPGVDLEHRFCPTYEVLPGKAKNMTELRRAAKGAREVWFATDLDREGEAIAWHLAEELKIDPRRAKRVMFSAITKDEIARAFQNPHPIDMDRVNAQQARRILDRIVGYQVSPLLWKKVARGLSAGRVQSVAVRLVVERERQIRAFVPDESWTITGYFALSGADAARLGPSWREFLARTNEKGEGPTVREQNGWLGDARAIRAELVEFDGAPFEPAIRADAIIGAIEGLDERSTRARLERAAKAFGTPGAHDLAPEVARVAGACGLRDVRVSVREDASGAGPARWRRSVAGVADPSITWAVRAIETKRSSVRPPPPFITSTLQQAASSRLGFGAQRTMRTAQGLYEGVDIPGEGPVGLITYMRTDSTHLSGAALEMARGYIRASFGDAYLPEKPNFFTSSNKDAQEAHEAIRPTSLNHPPARVKGALNPDQFRLYSLIWERFVACQMTPAQWDSTSAYLAHGPAVFRATGRVLVFDGFYKVAGVPKGDELTLPALREKQELHAFGFEPRQRFTSPPARYSEASLIKMLESEGIGRPSTYASIIGVIQDRKYVEQHDRRFHATDLGEVVTDKLIEAFPKIMDVGYTREMEAELDKVEEDHHDWVTMLEKFYGPFRDDLAHAMENLSHAKAETRPAPKEFRCQKCGAGLVYRFGSNGRFLSCSTFPACDYACPCDRDGRPRPVEATKVACPKCGAPMSKRTGRFGAFLGCTRYNDKASPCDGILRLDKKGRVVAPSVPPLVVEELKCEKCQSPMNLRSGLRGPWLGCSKFPKCRGRMAWNKIDPALQKSLEKALEAHDRAHPVTIVRTLQGAALTDEKGKPLPEADTLSGLAPGGDAAPGATLEAVAEELGV